MTFHGIMFDFIAARDHRLMRRVHRWKPPRWFRLWMIYATRAGDGWLWYGLSALILVCGGPARHAALSTRPSPTPRRSVVLGCSAFGGGAVGEVKFVGPESVTAPGRDPFNVKR